MQASPGGPAEVTTLNSPQFLADPYPFYARLRGQSPVYDPAAGLWCALSFADVYGILRDHATFSSAPGAGQGPGTGAERDPFGLVLITDDPPRHTRFRALVNKVFTPRRVRELEPWIRSVADELFDEIGADEVDIVRRYTVPLPVRTIARLLGIPGEDYERFKRWTDAFLFVDFGGDDPEAAARFAELREMLGYFGRLIVERREHSAADLITALVEAEIDSEHLQEWEILGFSVLLLVAGNETTTNLIGNMLNVLAGRPDLWEGLREDRGLIEPMIEETLRYESPVRLLFRRATRDVTLGGRVIPAQSQIGVFYGAANRDPAEFPQPDEFRLDRDLRNHVAFGQGIHYCLGAALARAEARITLDALLDRYAGIEPGGEPGVRQMTSPLVYGFARLPVVLR